MSYPRKIFMWSVMLAACSTIGLSQDNGCPISRVKVPPTLARQLLRQAFESMETPPDEQKQLMQEAEAREGGIASLFCAEAVDLDQDRKPDLLIHQADVVGAVCGAHNCPVWVYRRTGRGYQLLLAESGGYLSPLMALKTSTNGYRDIRIQQHSSAVEHEITIYKFDGRQYRARVCLTETYVESKRGRGRLKYTRHRCE